MSPFKPYQNVYELCNKAAEIVRGAGFILDYTSRHSEACYYRLPDRLAALRISAHSQTAQPRAHHIPVVARITFHPEKGDQMRITNDKVKQVVAQAIGQYMIATGKRDEAHGG